ncbi:MAG: hypothetical protein MUF64_23240 [Polyangiaceae bacterium]|jgi:hypothetical protein|nr:hypothetical protein [Polyangiaceae bacterium]
MNQGGDGYEFNEAQNGQISGLAGAMSFVGLLLLVSGVIEVVVGLVAMFGPTPGQGFGALAQGILNLLLGSWTRKAAGAFDQIVKTQGNDIDNLMAALGELSRVYHLQRVLVLVSVVVALGALAVGALAVLFVKATAP